MAPPDNLDDVRWGQTPGNCAGKSDRHSRPERSKAGLPVPTVGKPSRRVLFSGTPQSGFLFPQSDSNLGILHGASRQS